MSTAAVLVSPAQRLAEQLPPRGGNASNHKAFLDYLADMTTENVFDDAQCKGIPGIFDAGTDAPGALSLERARALCESCPALRACKRYALNSLDGQHGFWAGMTAKQRASIEEMRKRQANRERARKARAAIRTNREEVAL